MKIVVFTNNQRRHSALIQKLSAIGDVFAIVESAALLPATKAPVRSAVMNEYFSHVIAAEKKVFPRDGFDADIASVSIPIGDLTARGMDILREHGADDADYYVVFGSSYIKGDLIDFLISQKAVNIHMGTSPYYRGSSCNFWAMEDGNADYVGATLHRLSKGLDSGDIIRTVFPARKAYAPFDLGMEAVEAVQNHLCALIADGTLHEQPTTAQDRGKEIRYTRGADFTDEIAARYLENMLSPSDIEAKLKARDLSRFVNPFVKRAVQCPLFGDSV